MKKQTLIGILAAVSLLLASCAGPLTPSSTSGTKGATGSLSVSIPALAPWLSQALAGKPGSRAFLHVGKAVVQIQEASGTESAVTWSDVIVPVELSVQDGPSGNLGGVLTEIPVGDSYRVIVSLFADANAATPSAVGQQDNVWINSRDTNHLNLVCLPVVPESMQASVLQEDLTATPKELLNNAVVAANEEQWYSCVVKPKTTYYLTYHASGSVAGFAFWNDGRYQRTLNDGENWYFDSDRTDPFYFGVSGGTVDGGTFSLTLTEVPGTLVEGTVTFPPGSQGHQYRLFMDNNTTPLDGWNRGWGGSVDDSLTFHYWIPSQSASSFQVYAILEGDTPWPRVDWNRPEFYPAAEVGDSITAPLTVTVDGTGILPNQNIEGFTLVTNVVKGTITLPASAMGSWYRVFLDPDTADGGEVAYIGGQNYWNDATTIRFSFPNVPAGIYHGVAIIDKPKQWSDSAGTVASGDYVGVVGYTAFPAGTFDPHVTVTDGQTTTADMTAWVN